MNCSAIRALTDDRLLGSRIDQLSRRRGFDKLSAGLLLGDAQLIVASDNAHWPIPAGCLAKTITASLVAEAVAEGRLRWSDTIDDLLATQQPSRRKLAAVTMRHLLDHTHGLDASAMERIPRRTDGFIDAAGLCDALDTRRLCSPGALYSYGNAGGWLAGALLEVIYGKTYAQLLRERGLPGQSVPGADASAGTICPAMGEELRLTMAQWLAFAHMHIGGSMTPPPGSGALAALRELQVPLPGWHLSERAICLGWKSYGEGWFGHNSRLPGRSAILRVNPEERIAIVVAVEGDGPAALVLAALFGRSLPEFVNLEPPRLLSQLECGTIRHENYVGTYSQARTKIVVDVARDAALQLCVHDVCTNQHFGPSRLRPARGGLFIVEPVFDDALRFVQFIASPSSGEIEYLWNGSQLRRKE